MAKTIKFNLMMDGTPVRTLEELRDHFNIEDLLEHYHNGLLLRWLTVRGLQEHSEKIQAISAKNDADIARQLITIFEMHGNQEQAQEIIRAIELKKEHQRLLDDLSEKHFKREEVINTYHQEYEKLLNSLKPDGIVITKKTVDNLSSQIDGNFNQIRPLIDKKYADIFTLLQNVKDILGDYYINNYKAYILQSVQKQRKDFAVIKATINHFLTHYRELLRVDIVRLYDEFFEIEPLILMAILMDDDGRPLLFNNPLITQKLPQLIQANFLNSLPVKKFNKQTDGYWKDIEASGSRWMILRIESGCFVRNLGKQTEELSHDEVNGKFPILNGIDYKSNNANHKLIYLPCSEEHPFWKEPKK